MVIFLLAMVFTILMTIASTRKAVFGWSENGHFRHRRPLGERTDKLWKGESSSPAAETPEMYIYAISEKPLQWQAGNSPLAWAASALYTEDKYYC